MVFIYPSSLFPNGINPFEVPVNENGSFNYEVPISISPDLVEISINMTNISFLVNLVSNQETKLEIIFHEDRIMQVKIISGPDFLFINPEQRMHAAQLITNMARSGSEYEGNMTINTVNRFVENPKEYIPYFIKYNLNPRLEIMEKDSILNKNTKTHYINMFKTFMYRFNFFESSFSDDMVDFYKDLKLEEDTNTITTLKEPDISYYSFLKNLALNNPQYLYNLHYPLLCQRILSNKTFNISPIGETPIDEWLKGVRTILANLVGFDEGQFYDVLIGNAYAIQFEDEMKPLSNRQIQNIHTYFEGNGMEMVLLKRNEDVVESAKNRTKVIKNETPIVSDEKIIDAIVSNYKGKVVVVDFWATWCAPCLESMAKSIPLKNKMKDKDVVFVYITNSTSPKVLWDKKIKVIDGEHYYLNETQWKYIIEKNNINGIPAYLFYDRGGKLIEHHIGYPGTTKMQEIIERGLSQ